MSPESQTLRDTENSFICFAYESNVDPMDIVFCLTATREASARRSVDMIFPPRALRLLHRVQSQLLCDLTSSRTRPPFGLGQPYCSLTAGPQRPSYVRALDNGGL